jgi:PKHD-type hydroxylase
LEFILNRKITVPLKKGEIVFFHSDIPHQVDKVTKGNRKSLVGWIQGPAFR